MPRRSRGRRLGRSSVWKPRGRRRYPPQTHLQHIFNRTAVKLRVSHLIAKGEPVKTTLLAHSCAMPPTKPNIFICSSQITQLHQSFFFKTSFKSLLSLTWQIPVHGVSTETPWGLGQMMTQTGSHCLTELSV